jgi:ADP-ribose pyrophosphatase YjhB (NUDIX family)
MEEETGLKVEPLEVLTVFDRIERDAGRVTYHYVIVDYLCRWVGGRAAAASDALEVAWVAPGELPAYDLPAKALEVVGDAFRRAGSEALAAPAGARYPASGPGAPGADGRSR